MASLVDMGWYVITSTSAVTVNPPDNAVSCDVVVLGGGAGGKGNSTSVSVGYGNAGRWNSGTLPPVAFTAKAGAGGAGRGSAHVSGTSSTAGNITGSGGAGGSESASVSNAGSYDAFGRTFIGGGAVAPGIGFEAPESGKTPGGGGGGAIFLGSVPGDGARGQVWFRWWTNPKIQNLYVGGKEVQAVYVGSTEVTAVYSGNKIVYGAA